MPIKVGDKVKAITATFGWDVVTHKDVGTVIILSEGRAIVDFPLNHEWLAAVDDLVLAGRKPEAPFKRTAKVLVPTTDREKTAVRLIEKVTSGEGKFTAVKVESEGRLGRENHCTNCTLVNGKAHVGCKRFSDVKVANDFILKHLMKYGLAERCKQGEHYWSYLYKPKLPLVYSKVYTDSETEWTTTLSLEKGNDVLYTPMLVDAFNALAAANGNGIDVRSSGMHTAFIQGENGVYPDPRAKRKTQQKMFDNFAKSMRPLLPALYLLGANRIEDNQGVTGCVTRSINPRGPEISSTEKYSAIAYRYGAVEFRVFDTCYEHRDQILDNIVTMSLAVSKYWHAKYVKPNIKFKFDKPVLFGNDSCGNNVNKIESLYCVKEHVVLLNEGLRCIKPPYLSVKEVKMARRFSLTVRDIKTVLNTATAKKEHERQKQNAEIRRLVREAGYFYGRVERLESSRVPTLDLGAEISKLRKLSAKVAKTMVPIPSLEQIAYRDLFGGSGRIIGGK